VKIQVWMPIVWVPILGQMTAIGLACTANILLSHNDVTLAQVVPDRTLPVGERSSISGDPDIQIDGGATRGSNLFHSFQQFSIPINSSAFFNNATDITNIITRVTGNTRSDIDGLMRANGTANLFLINPNGIIFGPNARLDIGGSFLASTADSIIFADNFRYSAIDPQIPPLLTISVPTGLQMGPDASEIRVVGEGHSLTARDPVFSPLIRGVSQGLQVSPGKTLALLGGNVVLTGGMLKAEGGRIELGSVGLGEVSLTSTPSSWVLDYTNVSSFKDIQLSRQSLVDASGTLPGSIAFQGNAIAISDGSVILLQNQGGQPGGQITVKAVESLNVSGTTPGAKVTSNVASQNLGLGKSGDIAISAKQVIVQGGGQITVNSFGAGAGGSLALNAAQSIQLIGVSSINPLATSNIATVAYNSGNAGNLTVSTGQLVIRDGGVFVSTSFGAIGTGDSGNVAVNATESIEVSGVEPRFRQPSVLSAGAGNSGAGATLTINTAKLSVRGGASVSTATLANGKAGNLIVNAIDSVEVTGQAQGAFNRVSSIGSFARRIDPIIAKLFGLPSLPTGGSGDVAINTGRLKVTDNAVIDARNDGPGDGGTLSVNANAVLLDNRGSITATTVSGEGGNIRLNVRDVSLLRNNSQITASANGSGNGGNVTFNSKLIVAVPKEDSNLTANAFSGSGGNVRITTQGIFGIEPRAQATGLSDITASSDFGISGTVTLNTPDVDPSRGMTSLPTGLVDTNALISSSCLARRDRQGRFIITGTGGLATQPDDLANAAFPTYDLVPNVTTGANIPPSTLIVEADRAVRLANGNIVFGRSCD
jgi:filamentous hemagglutinin family protein